MNGQLFFLELAPEFPECQKMCKNFSSDGIGFPVDKSPRCVRVEFIQREGENSRIHFWCENWRT